MTKTNRATIERVLKTSRRVLVQWVCPATTCPTPVLEELDAAGLARRVARGDPQCARCRRVLTFYGFRSEAGKVYIGGRVLPPAFAALIGQFMTDIENRSR